MKTRILPLSSLFLTFLTFFIALSAQAQVPSYVPTNGLVGYWPFNGNSNDASGNGNNGTVNGASLTTDRFGNANSAYYFDGIDNLINVGNPSQLGNNPASYTQTVWARFEDFPLGIEGSYPIMSKRNANNGEDWATPLLRSTQVIWFFADDAFYGNGPVAISGALETATWYFLVFVKDGIYYRLYLNGQLIDEIIDNHLMDGSGNDLIFGAQLAWPQYLKGVLDDIGIWNRALTADEVLALYNGCNVASLIVLGNVTPTQFTQETYTYPNTVGSTYNWTVTNGVIVSGQGTNSIDVTWANTGIGSVSVVETNGTNCSGDVVNYDVVIIPTDVEEFSAAISLFPNPATTELNLQTTTELIGSDLIIFDALGKQIHKQQILSSNTQINTSAFATGNYVVKAGGVVKRFEVRK